MIRPNVTKRYSVLECVRSDAVTDSGSRNAVLASSNETPCLVRLNVRVKGGQSRDIPLPSAVMAFLHEYLTRVVKTETEKVGYYNAADLFVSPSSLEGFGFTVGEAMSCGLPVVASDRGALPELVVHGEGGFVCRHL